MLVVSDPWSPIAHVSRNYTNVPAVLLADHYHEKAADLASQFVNATNSEGVEPVPKSLTINGLAGVREFFFFWEGGRERKKQESERKKASESEIKSESAKERKRARAKERERARSSASGVCQRDPLLRAKLEQEDARLKREGEGEARVMSTGEAEERGREQRRTGRGRKN